MKYKLGTKVKVVKALSDAVSPWIGHSGVVVKHCLNEKGNTLHIVAFRVIGTDGFFYDELESV